MELEPICRANKSDVGEIFSLYRISIEAFEKLGIFQWNDAYPTLQDLRENLAAGSTWILKHNGIIIAAVTLNSEQESQYSQIKWAYPSEKILVIHRLVIHPDFQGKGLAKKMVLYSEEFALQNGYEVIRIDAFIGNPYSQNLYKHMGYHEAVGYCYYHDPAIMCNCFDSGFKKSPIWLRGIQSLNLIFDTCKD
jgi:GNAT superfamily N-acetyltransferase